MIDYKRAFKIACELLNGAILYGVDKDSIFETIMNKDGVVDNESYENYILSHMDELDRGNGMTREEAIKRLKEARNTIQPFQYVNEAIDYAIKLIEQKPCEDCVGKQAVAEVLLKYAHTPTGKAFAEFLVSQINALPPVTPQPKTGHWIKEKSLHGWDGKSYQCSVCGRSIHLDPEVEDLPDYPYCHCGAKMESEE